MRERSRRREERNCAPEEEPFALVDKRRGAVILEAPDRQAISLGLTAGMKLADARARVPTLATFPHDPAADQLWLEQMALYCERYTPVTALRPPASLILDIMGCAHIYGGEGGLVRHVEDSFDRAGLSLKWAIASSVDGALALARFGLKEGAEAQLPVAALNMGDKVHRALERAGLYQIGDLENRPAAPLAARFGSEIIWKLDSLMGRQEQPVNPPRREIPVMAERRFAEPMGHMETAMLCLKELFVEAADTLEKRAQGARKITIQLFRCDGHTAQLEIETGAPTRDCRLFERLLKERIDVLHDPLDSGFGYDLVRLHIPRSEPLLLQQQGMGDTPDDNIADGDIGDEAALLSQISIRLGRRSVQRFEPADSHIPEDNLRVHAAMDHKDYTAGCNNSMWDDTDKAEPPRRPIWLLDPPENIEVLAEVPDGAPRRFRWNRDTYDIAHAEGPERIAATWWRRMQGYLPGQAGATRDYYRVEDSDGRRYWLFRRGLYDTESQQPDWYLHGLFA